MQNKIPLLKIIMSLQAVYSIYSPPQYSPYRPPKRELASYPQSVLVFIAMNYTDYPLSLAILVCLDTQKLSH